MNLKKLIQISVANQKELQFVQQVYRFFSVVIALVLKRTFVTPNLISFVGFWIGLLAGVLLYCGHFGYGILLAHLALMADYADGALARIRKQFSVVGEWLEGIVVDKTVDVFVYAGLGIGLYNISQNVQILFLTMAIVVTKLLTAAASDSVHYYHAFHQITKGTKLKKSFFTKNDFLTFLAKQAVPTRTNIYLLLALGVIVNQKLLSFIILGIYSFLFYVVYMFYFAQKLNSIWKKKEKKFTHLENDPRVS